MPTTYGTKTLKKSVRKRAEKIDMDRLVELAKFQKDDGTYMSHQEIADNMGCARPTVTRALQRIPPWIIGVKDLDAYKRKRADVFAQAQQLILDYITPDKLKGASLQQLGTLFGIFYDKERLELGKATSHVAEVSVRMLDSETKKLIEQAIQNRTKVLLDQSKKQNLAEQESVPGDSGDSQVSNS